MKGIARVLDDGGTALIVGEPVRSMLWPHDLTECPGGRPWDQRARVLGIHLPLGSPGIGTVPVGLPAQVNRNGIRPRQPGYRSRTGVCLCSDCSDLAASGGTLGFVARYQYCTPLPIRSSSWLLESCVEHLDDGNLGPVATSRCS